MRVLNSGTRFFYEVIMEKVGRDLDLGWIRSTNGNGSYIWKCYDPKTKELLGIYRDEETESEKTKIDNLKKRAHQYVGVHFHNSSYRRGSAKIWESRLTEGRKRYYLGIHDTPEKAAIAYNQKVIEIGANKPLNEI